MAEKEEQAVGADIAGVVASAAPAQYREYTYKGHPDSKIGDEIFHRAAGPMKPGDKVMLSDQHAAELEALGYKLSESKS